MSKLDQRITRAIQGNHRFNDGNTNITPDRGCPYGFEMTLHNSRIVIKDNDGVRLNLCGYNTRVTRSRMNVALSALQIPYHVTVKAGEPRLVHTATNKARLIPANGWFPVN
jgi:hypothetical protein